MEDHYYVLIISLLVGAIAGIIFSPKNSLKSTTRDALIAAIVSATSTTLYSAMVEMNKINQLRSELVSQREESLYEQLETKISKKTNSDHVYSSFKKYQNKLTKELESALLGTLRLDDEDEVLIEWKKMFQGSQSKTIKATNIIPATFWLEQSSFGVEQLRIQKEAIERDFNIHRIFIYERSDNDELIALQKVAKQHLEIGIKVKFLEFSKLKESVVFNKNQVAIYGAEDIVVADENVVLLTFPNNKSGNINHGYISEDRATVDAALIIYGELWKIATENI